MKRWRKRACALLLSAFCVGCLPLYGQAATGPNGVSDGLEAYWNLDEGSGSTAQEVTGNVDGRDLTVVGETQWVDGVNGIAFYLDGFTVLSMNGDQQIRSMDLSISLWAKIEGFPNPEGETPEFDQHKLMVIEGIGSLSIGAVDFGFWDGTPSASIIVDRQMNSDSMLGDEAIALDGQWHQYGLVIDDAGEVMKYYVDGVMVKEQNLIRSLGLPKLLGVPEDKGYVGNLNIGGYVDVDGKTVSRGIQGAIDEIAVYSKALSDSEMQQLASTGSSAGTTAQTPTTTNTPVAPTTTRATTVRNDATTTLQSGNTTTEVSSTTTSAETSTSSSVNTTTSATQPVNGEPGEDGGSSWVLPVVIIVILVVLGGGGAAVYYFLVIRKKKLS